MNIMERFIVGEFGVHVGEEFVREFLEICEEYGLKPDGPKSALEWMDSLDIRPTLCIDCSVRHPGGGVLYADQVRYYNDNGYMIMSFSEFETAFIESIGFTEPTSNEILLSILI